MHGEGGERGGDNLQYITSFKGKVSIGVVTIINFILKCMFVGENWC